MNATCLQERPVKVAGQVSSTESLSSASCLKIFVQDRDVAHAVKVNREDYPISIPDLRIQELVPSLNASTLKATPL